eukprot:scaffold9373_cov107-Isochrysis_galbana.AAC.2
MARGRHHLRLAARHITEHCIYHSRPSSRLLAGGGASYAFATAARIIYCLLSILYLSTNYLLSPFGIRGLGIIMDLINHQSCGLSA